MDVVRTLQAELLGECSESEYEANLKELQYFIWQMVLVSRTDVFYTTRKRPYHFLIKEDMIAVHHKLRKIPKESVDRAVEKMIALQKAGIAIKQPKQLEVYGAKYIYPMLKVWGMIVDGD